GTAGRADVFYLVNVPFQGTNMRAGQSIDRPVQHPSRPSKHAGRDRYDSSWSSFEFRCSASVRISRFATRVSLIEIQGNMCEYMFRTRFMTSMCPRKKSRVGNSSGMQSDLYFLIISSR